MTQVFEMNVTKDSAMTQVFESKWGFHPVSRETSRKLRFLNGFYQKALHRYAAWNRWDVKSPQNRVHKIRIRDEKGQVIDYRKEEWKEPKIISLFTQKKTKKSNYHPKKGWIGDGAIYTYLEMNSLGIPEMSKAARTPYATKESVKPLALSEEQIDALYNDAIKWLEINS
jgi:hypothetical protein